MMRCRVSMRTGKGVSAMVLMCFVLNGCAGESLQQIANLPSRAAALTKGQQSTFQGAPAEIYSRIARGMQLCWFRPARGAVDLADGKGKLTGHRYFARTSPNRESPEAYISVHTGTHANKRGRKVFAIAIQGSAKESIVTMTNHALPIPRAQLLEKDVRHWAKNGTQDCVPSDARSMVQQVKKRKR